MVFLPLIPQFLRALNYNTLMDNLVENVKRLRESIFLNIGVGLKNKIVEFLEMNLLNI